MNFRNVNKVLHQSGVKSHFKSHGENTVVYKLRSHNWRTINTSNMCKYKIKLKNSNIKTQNWLFLNKNIQQESKDFVYVSKVHNIYFYKCIYFRLLMMVSIETVTLS